MARIEIINWEKYQPRGDVKHSSWYRFEHSIHFHPDWRHFDGQELHVFNFLLGLASFTNKSEFNLDLPYFEAVARVSKAKITSAIEKLEAMQVVRVHERERNEHVTDAVRTRSPTDGRTDGRTDNMGAVAPEFDFETLFGNYPRRRGDQRKKDGLAACKRRIKSQAEYDRLLAAVKAYAEFCRRENRVGTEYVKQFATFVNGSWDEWLPTAPIHRPPKVEDDPDVKLWAEIERKLRDGEPLSAPPDEGVPAC